jgi:hypothetical protein
MFEALGWFTLAGGGAWIFGRLATILVPGFGVSRLTGLSRERQAGLIVAVAWITLVVWWSPLDIGSH